jgi:uncharacterized membrane protein
MMKSIAAILIGGTPLIMAIITNIFPAKKMSNWYGYRTALARTNQDTWDEAQRYSTDIMTYIGYITLPLVFAIFYFTTNTWWVLAVAMTMPVLVVVSVVVFTEKHLTKTFDEDGDRIN